MSTGDKYFKVTDKTINGIATVKLPIPAGKTYRLDMICNFSVYSGSGHLELALCDGQLNVLKTLYSGTPVFSRKTFNFEIDGRDDLYFMIGIKGDSAFWWNSASFADQSTDKKILDYLKDFWNSLKDWLQGIWDSIKEIPTKIGQFITTLGDRIRDFFSNLGDRIGNFFTDLWERIKAFFLPSDGFFDTYSASFKQFVSDHFGFLADFPKELSLLFDTVVSFEPADPPYIDFPEIKLPMPGKTYTILERQRYTFDFLGNQPWSTLYSAYQAFVWLAYCLMLINLIRRKYAVVFGGSANAD